VGNVGHQGIKYLLNRITVNRFHIRMSAPSSLAFVAAVVKRWKSPGPIYNHGWTRINTDKNPTNLSWPPRSTKLSPVGPRLRRFGLGLRRHVTAFKARTCPRSPKCCLSADGPRLRRTVFP
jgi:hypothetical protein